MKTILISCSGGLDSVALVQHYLKLNWNVDTVYTEIQNNPEKTKRELNALNNLRPFFEEMGNYSHLGKNAMRISVLFNSGIDLKQYPIFLTSLFYSVQKKHDAVALGFVLGDQAVSYIPDITKTWKSYQGNCTFPLPPLIFPFIKKHKTELHNSLSTELKELITWCESSNENDFCGECSSCETMIANKLFPNTGLMHRRFHNESKLIDHVFDSKRLAITPA